MPRPPSKRRACEYVSRLLQAEEEAEAHPGPWAKFLRP